MAGGRPGFDKELIAQQMIEWSKLDDSINLCGFSADHDVSPRIIMQWAKENEQFSRTYEAVKTRIGARRERKLNEGKLHVKAYDLNANVYDLYRKEESREQLTFESDLKNKDANTQIENLSTLIDQIKNGQISQTDS